MLFNPVVHVISPMVVALYYALSPARCWPLLLGELLLLHVLASGVRAPPLAFDRRRLLVRDPNGGASDAAAHGGRFSTSVSLAISASFTLALRFLHEQHRTSGSRTCSLFELPHKPVVAGRDVLYVSNFVLRDRCLSRRDASRATFWLLRAVRFVLSATGRRGPSSVSDHLHPQLWQPVRFESANVRAGLQIMLWDFKKIVVADRLAIYVNQVYGAPSEYAAGRFGSRPCLRRADLLRFSGYSDIALGRRAILGHKLMLNFRTPYFARSTKNSGSAGMFRFRSGFGTTSTFRSAAIAVARAGTRISASFSSSVVSHGAN